MGKKLTNLNRYISVITDIDENGFVSFEHIINNHSFAYVRSPQFEYHFSAYFYVFVFFFLFLPMLYF